METFPRVRLRKARTSKGSPAEAKTYALKLLGYRSRSRKEILERLERKGFDEEQIRSAIGFLEDAGLLNDAILASDLFEYSTGKKSLGKKGIRMFLAKRGIDKELINKTLLTHTPEMEEKSAVEFVEKKIRTMRNYPADIVRKRLWGMLRRRGFSGEIIRKVLNSSL